VFDTHVLPAAPGDGEDRDPGRAGRGTPGTADTMRYRAHGRTGPPRPDEVLIADWPRAGSPHGTKPRTSVASTVKDA